VDWRNLVGVGVQQGKHCVDRVEVQPFFMLCEGGLGDG